MFKPVGSKVDFNELEKAIISFWKEKRIFERSVEERQGSPLFMLYEGPPTANGSPGIHHVLARVFKDVMPRYKTMKGFCAPRKGGWDTHGLPVELEIERELGISNKTQIEEYGIDKFNARCRESVFKYVKEWESLTQRIGFWLDMKDPYITYQNSYIETLWWIMKQFWDKGLIYRGHKVTPHCPRCGTSLSSHEVALGYRDDTKDPSIHIRFRLREEVDAEKTPLVKELGWDAQQGWTSRRPALLAWTTTPWTLTANVALAVCPDEDYVLLEAEGPDGAPERLIFAEALVEKTLKGSEYRILKSFPGKTLTGLPYEPLFSFVKPDKPAHYVTTADFVFMDEGTGIVHIAPAYGADDMELGRANNLPVIHTVDLDGNLIPAVTPWAGVFVKDADESIMRELDSRGLLFRRGTILHTYPFCWRCGTPLLYYAKSSWYIKTTARKDRLIAGNEQINWYPGHIKQGRFGDWLQNNVDWAFSRERYWGTPAPIWRCDSCEDYHCIGSLEELRNSPGVSGYSEDIDLHRPYVDAVTFDCPGCRGTMRRVTEVMDCWFDSGAMPFAQSHYPFENQTLLDNGRFPADFICEAVDQTRGWFYSLHAISTLLLDKPCYRNVICLGLILDAKGEKMSKSKGNVVEPGAVLDQYGADALRWYLYTGCPPGNVRRFSTEAVGEMLRKFFLTLWNTYSFFVTYANIDKFDPGAVAAPERTSELDRWIISELNQLTKEVTELLDDYNPTDAGRRIETFVDGLSNWYVRRSRRRFWKSENDADKLAAYSTLYECLVTVSKLLAPLAPFIAEEMYQNLVRSFDASAPDSIHLTSFPVADETKIEKELTEDTRLVMKVCSLGRAARSKANLKVRQPVAQVLVKVRTKAERQGLERLAHQVQDELNVKQVALVDREEELLDFTVKPNLPLLGPKYGKEMGKITAALREMEPAPLASSVREGKDVAVAGFELLPEEILVESSDRPGLAVASEAGYVVAVPTTVSPELAEEGLARELVHRLQTMRRSAGLDIADHIVIYYQGGPAIQRVMSAFADYVKQETLSYQILDQPPRDGAYVETHKVDGQEVTLGVEKKD
ncbi:MAG: isoleucine--tRNA ligase [Chloroflexi bacterium]|nr:isoleucine--tRNA ligase [Chloroflexota bacterium]